MNKLAIAIAIGAAAVMGGSAASASDKVTTKSSAGINQPLTDFSSQHRHFHRHHHHGHRHHWRHHHRPYYRSYNYYAPRHHGYYGGGPRYYGGGPGVTFSFGSGGYRGW